MNKSTYVNVFMALMTCTIFAQVGIGTTTPDPSSILELNSNTAGFLPPRMTTAERTAILDPVDGLMVYDTDESAYFFYEGSSWSQLINQSSVNDYTGWADYVDTEYTSASPYIVTTTKTTLPNNAGRIVDFQKPIDVSTFYDPGTDPTTDPGTITGRNGDGINIVIEFKCRPNSAAETRITVAIDIGGTVGEIYKRDFVLAKGNNVEHYYLSSFSGYTLGTFEANGGQVRIISTASTDVYDIRYVITRTHKAR